MGPDLDEVLFLGSGEELSAFGVGSGALLFLLECLPPGLGEVGLQLVVDPRSGQLLNSILLTFHNQGSV